MLLSVSVIYRTIDQKMIPFAYHKQKKRKNVLNSIQFTSLFFDPLQGQRPHGYRNTCIYNFSYICKNADSL